MCIGQFWKESSSFLRCVRHRMWLDGKSNTLMDKTAVEPYVGCCSSFYVFVLYLNIMDDIRIQRGSIRRFTSFEAMKADEYAYWQSRPVHERLAAVTELSIEGYRLKGALPRESGLRGPACSSERGRR